MTGSSASVRVEVRDLDADSMTKPPSREPHLDQDAAVSIELQVVFGDSLRAARLKANLTQVEVSERSGVAREDVSRIENGQSNLTLRTMTRLASVFSTDVVSMLTPPTAKKS